ncbi:MAG TPA: S9 family peptidase [Pyrinomonadaceae bacterium]|jgi:dipeptidyl aminopeptidase/acylaminoacyl peptidase
MKKIFCAFFLLLFASIGFAQNYSIERYLNIRSAGSPSFSADGKRIAFLTNITGTSQIWMMDSSGGYPEQITSFQDNVGFVRWSPAGNGLVFGKASGGDENTQFFWLSSDGAEIKQLTSDPKVRYNFGDFTGDGTRIFYSSNKRDRNFFDVYSMDIASGKEELIYQQDGSNDVAGVSAKGSQIVVSRSGTELSLDNDLYLIDPKTKAATHITKHAGAAEFGDVHFLPDGDSIVLTTNKDREFFSLAQIDNLRTDGANQLFVDRNAPVWDVESVRVSPRGDRVAYTVNREGFSELHLRGLEVNGKPLITKILEKDETVQLPAQGIVGGLEFSKDGGKLAFTFNSAKYNSDIWIYDLQTKNLTQLTKSSRSGIPQSSFVEPQLIKFKTFDGREIPAWYYKPEQLVAKGDKTSISVGQTQNLPVIVSVHGGPEGQERPGFNSLYQYFLARGYAILATNVRGSTGYGKTFTHLDDVRKREDSVKDLAAAVEWLKRTGGADYKRIAVMGGSYGGYMTLAAITLYPDLWAAAVDTVGIANWESFLKNTSGYRRRQREVEYGMLDKDLDFLKSISPLARVDKIKAPLFVIQGKNDPRVPYTEAEQIVTALKNRGAIVQYKLYDDEGHGISKLKNRLELYPLVADFLDKYMK